MEINESIIDESVSASGWPELPSPGWLFQMT